MFEKFTGCAMAENDGIIFKKIICGEDASIFGAFSFGTQLIFSLTIPRRFGITYPTLRIDADGHGYFEFPLSYNGTENESDIFEIEIKLSDICHEEKSGLFYYDFIFPTENGSLFSSTEDNLHLDLSSKEGSKFRLLVYEDGFNTPTWFHGGTMYHIFVDRFAKGSFEPVCRPDAEMNHDWENGVPQYGEYPGAFVKNNVFFGGNLIGVREKLDYLVSLGVSVIYLSPIFKAYSNHKYDTGDYMTVDEMFGGDKALKELITEASRKDIKIILDGVFNHTGDDSLYFNKYGKYDSLGAYESRESEYYNWYNFKNHPDEYESWWGIPILPRLNHSYEKCLDYFVMGEDSVVGKYTKMGIGGIRLDVADELSDAFLDKLRLTAKDLSDNNAVIIGEVWENAADKIAYGKRRKYLRGAQLDSVMNYPFRSATLDYLLSGDSALLARALTEIYASYPKCVSDSLMNILGTHDTERILTVLGGEDKYDLPNCELAKVKMSDTAKERAVKLLKLGSVVQYTVYGIPSVFYGDEAGLEGYRDPFCRMPFPWGHENGELLSHYRLLGQIRKENGVFSAGLFRVNKYEGSYIEYERYDGENKITVAINAGDRPFATDISGFDLLSDAVFTEDSPLPPYSAVILKR
ncbi:MAG: glycoside hydrolase family 13 protein [Ruminococcaceae bacterium]|nr:glycoside hydrolase family 13 protein [Oscillospiraceae bacterium]